MDKNIQKWFMAVIEGLVKNPESANVGYVHGGLDLEVVIKVAPEDRSVFTEEVCLALTTLLRVATGVVQPVVYMDGDPHPAAAESLRYKHSKV